MGGSEGSATPRIRAARGRGRLGRTGAALVVVLGIGWGCGDAAPEPRDDAPPPNAQGLRYADAPFAEYRVSDDPQEAEAVFTRWFEERQDELIDAHGFRILASITKPSGQYFEFDEDTLERRIVDEPGEGRLPIPRFDTWYGEKEVFDVPGATPPPSGVLPLHPPAQGGSEVTTFNKYNLAFHDYVHEHAYNDPDTLIELNAKFDRERTPLAERRTEDPPLSGIVLKPTYWAVKRGQVSALPYWKGPADTIAGTVNPHIPTDRTWTQIVLVNDTGEQVPLTEREITVYAKSGPETIKVAPLKAVTVDDFYAIPLSQADIDWVQGPGNVFQWGGISPKDLEPGDYALLVGMHVTTVEWSKWTWQTIWWAPDATAARAAGLPDPWSNYDMRTAYYFDDADGSPRIAFNPHLETPINGPTFMNPTDRGAASNCMSCHHAAAFPTVSGDPNPANMLEGSYVATGAVSGEEQWMEGRTKTNFMWGMVVGLQPTEQYRKWVEGEK